MATTSETGQVVNGIETDKPEVSTEKSGKAEAVVKPLNAVTNDTMKISTETTQNENGESEEKKLTSADHEHATTTVSETPTSEAEDKPVMAVALKPLEAVVAAAVLAKPTPSCIEPMDTEPAPPASVTTEESAAVKPEEITGKAKSEEQVAEEKPEAADDTEKPSEDVAASAAVEEPEAVSEPATTVMGAAKRGRKPGPKKAAATPKKTPAVAAAATEQTAAEVETKEANLAAGAEQISPKRTPRRKREMLSPEAAAAGGDKTPLLEAPLIIEGKRTRQRVERLDSTVLTPDKRPTEVPEGKGTKLSDIPYIDAMISKSSTTDLKLLHRLVFGRAGTAHELKKHLRLFNGFGFAADSTEYEKKKKSLETAVLSDLKTTCGILGLEKGGKKDELIDVILKFVLKPVDMGKQAPQSTSRRSSSTTRKSTGKRRTGRGKKDEHSGDEEEDHDEEDEEHDEDAEHEEQEEPAPKRGRKSKAAAATPEVAPSASKRAASTKKTAFPSDTDIKSTIKDLLKDVNLEQVTMKEMTAKVYDHYPNIDLTNKKEYIKDTVKALLSSSE